MIQTVACPKCKKTANVPSHIMTVKCSKCGKIFNVNAVDEEAAGPDAASDAAGTMEGRASKKVGKLKIVAGILGGLLVVAGAAGGGYHWWINRPPPTVYLTPEDLKNQVDPDDVVWTAPEFREADMAEPDRKRIYDDMRIAAVKTIEQPLLLIGPPRTAMEKLLQAEYEREMRTQAALHDIDLDDIQQIVNEGDAKKWDPRPRSNATRNGKRIYPKSWSEGWKR